MTSPNPYEAAMTATKPNELSNHKFGYCFFTDARFVVLEKGKGRVAYDARIHTKQPSVETVIQIEHIKADGTTYTVQQTELDWSKQWGITRDSLIALNLKNASDLKNRYVEYEWAGVGEFYTDKNGTQRERQGMCFIRVFNNREECEAAEREFYSPKSPATAPDVEAFLSQREREQTVRELAAEQKTQREAKAAGVGVVVAAVANEAERAMAATFLPTFWQQAGGNAEVFHALIAANASLAKYFNANSPEVCALTDDVPF